jgi:hypothetical protein
MVTNQHAVREQRHALGVRPVYKRVDTCAAEFATETAYLYSSYDEESLPPSPTAAALPAAAQAAASPSKTSSPS